MKYTFSFYKEDRRVPKLVPHSVWWRNAIGQKQLIFSHSWDRESFTINIPDEEAGIASKDWFHNILKEVSGNNGKGYQLEEGTYPTSFIPTSKYSTATRSADVVRARPLIKDALAAHERGEEIYAEYLSIENDKNAPRYVKDEYGCKSFLVEPQRTNLMKNEELTPEDINEIINDVPNQYFEGYD